MQNTMARSTNNRLILASSLAMLTALSPFNMKAESAPRKLTREQYIQQRNHYFTYQRYVQTQVLRQEQTSLQQKVAREQQLALQQQQVAQKTPSTSTTATGAKPAKKHAPIARQDVLLVMPNNGAKGEDIAAAVEAANGEICGGLGSGSLGVILVAAKPGKVVELQRKLAADTRDFKYVDFNRPCQGTQATWGPGYNEPTFPQSWHLTRLNIPDAWDYVIYGGGFPMPIAVFDTGIQGTEAFASGQGVDCTGTVGNKQVNDLGFNFNGILGTGIDKDSIKAQESDIVHIGNYIKTMTYCMSDPHGHGTWVSCTINGNPFNSQGSAGVNPMVPVYAIRVGWPAKDPTQPPVSDDLAMIKAMCVMYDTANTRIINISYDKICDARGNQILHEFFKDWYYRKNRLIFDSAGNTGENLAAVNQPYVNVVSAMAHKDGIQIVKNKHWASCYGPCIDFTAPGQDIQVCDPDNKPDSVDGTSFASPICAAVASLIWTINPNLKNTQVEQIMRDSCDNVGQAYSNPQFGYGVPDALQCVKAAKASLGSK
jgi:subtilisin family serine protease